MARNSSACNPGAGKDSEVSSWRDLHTSHQGDKYYFGADELFTRHPEVIQRLCISDRLIWGALSSIMFHHEIKACAGLRLCHSPEQFLGHRWTEAIRHPNFFGHCWMDLSGVLDKQRMASGEWTFTPAVCREGLFCLHCTAKEAGSLKPSSENCLSLIFWMPLRCHDSLWYGYQVARLCPSFL